MNRPLLVLLLCLGCSAAPGADDGPRRGGLPPGEGDAGAGADVGEAAPPQDAAPLAPDVGTPAAPDAATDATPPALCPTVANHTAPRCTGAPVQGVHCGQLAYESAGVHRVVPCLICDPPPPQRCGVPGPAFCVRACADCEICGARFLPN